MFNQILSSLVYSAIYSTILQDTVLIFHSGEY